MKQQSDKWQKKTSKQETERRTLKRPEGGEKHQEYSLRENRGRAWVGADI